MSEVTFKGRKGQYTATEAPDSLLKWYAAQENPSVRAQKSAAIEILKDRAAKGIVVSDDAAKAQPVSSASAKSEPPKAIVPASGAIQPFVSTESEFLNKQLALVSEHCHLITPTTVFSQLPTGYSAQLTLVEISKQDDCVQVEGALMLSAATLKRVNTAVGMSWNMEFTKRTDDGKERNYWSYRAVGRYLDIDGTMRDLSGEYEFDMRDDSARVQQIWAKAEANAREDADKEFEAQRLQGSAEELDARWNAIHERCLERRNLAAQRDIDSQRKNGLTRAETGAKSRVTSELLKRSEKGSNAWNKPIACVRLIKTRNPAASVAALYPTTADKPADGQVIEGTFETENTEGDTKK